MLDASDESPEQDLKAVVTRGTSLIAVAEPFHGSTVINYSSLVQAISKD